MGQTYTVELNLNIKSEPELVKRSNDYFKAIEVADKEDFINLNTADEVLRSVFPNLDAWGGARYSADFDASYGWENVMYQWFKAVAPALKEGSSIEVWPDSGSWGLVVNSSGGIEDLVKKKPEYVSPFDRLHFRKSHRFNPKKLNSGVIAHVRSVGGEAICVDEYKEDDRDDLISYYEYEVEERGNRYVKYILDALKSGDTVIWDPEVPRDRGVPTNNESVNEGKTTLEEVKETNFDFRAFEEHLPHEMRFKHAQVMPDGTLYWVTYGFFDERDLRDFRDALDKFTSRKRAFVTSRDVSTFDYMSDLRYEVGAEIDLGNNICNYEDYRNATADNEDDFVTEGAEGKRDPEFEYVIYDYTDEDEGYCPIVAKRSTRIEAESTAATWMGNMYGKPARKKFEDRLLTFEKVPKGKFNVGDDFYGPFDDDWNKVESLHDEEPRFMYSRTENGKKFDIFRGVKGGKGKWSAKPDDGEEFEISYEQGVGEKPISGVADLGRTLGKKSGLKRQ